MKSLLHLLFGICLLASTAGAQTPQLKAGDYKKLAKAVGPWVVAQIDNEAKDRLDARDDILKVIKGFEKKKIAGPELYRYLDDWGLAMEGRGGKFPKAKAGKLATDTLGGDQTLSYWVPKNYKPKKAGVPLVLFFGDGSEVTESSIEGLPASLLENCAIAKVDLSSVADDELDNAGRISFLRPVAWVSMRLRLNRNRVYVIAGGSAAAKAAKLCSSVPHIVSGLALYGDYSLDQVNATNLNLITIEKVADVAAAAAWVAEAPDRDPYPLKVTFELRESPFTRFFWVQVRKSDPPEEGKVTTITVEADRATNTITITADRVYQVELFLNDRIVDLSKPITLIRNGQSITHEANPGFSTLFLNVEKYLWDTSAIYPAMLRGIDIPVKE